MPICFLLTVCGKVFSDTQKVTVSDFSRWELEHKLWTGQCIMKCTRKIELQNVCVSHYSIVLSNLPLQLILHASTIGSGLITRLWLEFGVGLKKLSVGITGFCSTAAVQTRVWAIVMASPHLSPRRIQTGWGTWMHVASPCTKFLVLTGSLLLGSDKTMLDPVFLEIYKFSTASGGFASLSVS